MKTHKTQVRQDRQHRCKAIDMLLQHHAVTHTIAIITTCCSYSTTGSHAWQQLHGTRADATMHSPAHTDTAAGLLTRFRWRTRDPQLLSDQNTHCPGTPSMPSHGRRRQEHPESQSLCRCAWRLPNSGQAVQIAGGHGGRTQSEYSESSPSASGLARQCTPPRDQTTGRGHQDRHPRCLEMATNGTNSKKKRRQ